MLKRVHCSFVQPILTNWKRNVIQRGQPVSGWKAALIWFISKLIADYEINFIRWNCVEPNFMMRKDNFYDMTLWWKLSANSSRKSFEQININSKLARWRDCWRIHIKFFKCSDIKASRRAEKWPVSFLKYLDDCIEKATHSCPSCFVEFKRRP